MDGGRGGRIGELGSGTGIEFEEAFGADALGELGLGDALLDGGRGGSVGEGVDFTEAFSERLE